MTETSQIILLFIMLAMAIGGFVFAVWMLVETVCEGMKRKPLTDWLTKVVERQLGDTLTPRAKRGPDRQSVQRQASQAESNVENTQRGPEKEGETTMTDYFLTLRDETEKHESIKAARMATIKKVVENDDLLEHLQMLCEELAGSRYRAYKDERYVDLDRSEMHGEYKAYSDVAEHVYLLIRERDRQAKKKRLSDIKIPIQVDAEKVAEIVVQRLRDALNEEDT